MAVVSLGRKTFIKSLSNVTLIFKIANESHPFLWKMLWIILKAQKNNCRVFQKESQNILVLLTAKQQDIHKFSFKCNIDVQDCPWRPFIAPENSTNYFKACEKWLQCLPEESWGYIGPSDVQAPIKSLSNITLMFKVVHESRLFLWKMVWIILKS